MALREQVPQTNQGLHSQPGQAWGSPSRAPPCSTPKTWRSLGGNSHGETQVSGEARGTGLVEVYSGGQLCPFQIGRKRSWAATLWLSEAGCAPIATLPGSPFPVSPPLGWHHLKSSSPAGGQGPTAPSVERTWGWNWSDLIKAVTAHQVVTRSWGQPEKVVTYQFPHLTYSCVPVWHVVSVTAGRNCTIPLRAPTLLTAL